MNRREALKATFTAGTALSLLNHTRVWAQSPKSAAEPAGPTVYLHPTTGADTNAGTKDRPLRTLAEAARRVNQSTGSGPMTVVLAEGIYAL
jgi:hypothetical protein